MNHEGTKNTKEEGKKKNLFTRQLVLDRLLVVCQDKNDGL
jgi:hypothetical protein